MEGNRPSAGPARERICQALIDLVLERGYAETEVEEVLDRAGASRADFDRHFASKEDCFVQTFDTYVVEPFEARIVSAFARHAKWLDAIRASAYETARFLRDNPRECRFGAVEMLEVGPVAQAHRERQLHRVVDLIDAGRWELEDPDSMGRSAAEATLGSIYAVAVREVANESGDSFEDLVPELMYIAVRPYLGHEVAREELTIPPPEERSMPDERGRIREAVVDLVLEHGCEAVDVEMVVARAELEPAAFGHHFADMDDCLIDAYLIYTGEFDRRVFGAFRAERDWRDALRAAAYAAAAYIREQPREVAFGAVALLAASPAVQAHRESHHQRMLDLIDAGRGELEDPDAVGREVAEGVFAAIDETVVRELGSGPVKAPEDYVPQLMAIAVRPYLGDEAAAEELEMPPPGAGEPDA